VNGSERPTDADRWILCARIRGRACACRAAGRRPCPSVARLFFAPGGGWLSIDAAAACPAGEREASRSPLAAEHFAGVVVTIATALAQGGAVQGCDVAAAAMAEGLTMGEVRRGLLSAGLAGSLRRRDAGPADASRWHVTPAPGAVGDPP
jgi:hypothetical protein